MEVRLFQSGNIPILKKSLSRVILITLIGSFSFNIGYNRMFDLFPTNIFMFKFNYWISI